MMLSRGNDFRWLREAKLPDTTNHRSKAYVARGTTYLKNETFIGSGLVAIVGDIFVENGARGGAAMLRAVLPIVRGRDTAVAACWLREGSTAIVIGHDTRSTYRRFLGGQNWQGFTEGLFVSRRRRNRRCA
jgi:hypothetical protein